MKNDYCGERKKQMSQWLEDFSNPIAQVLNEFLAFIFLTYHDSKENRMLHNILTQSLTLHLRILDDFFSNHRKYNDDYIYKDFIQGSRDLSVSLPETVREFINKNRMHLTKKRGNVQVNKTEMIQGICQVVKSIHGFMEELKNNIAPVHEQSYGDPQVQELCQCVYTQMIKLTSLNAHEGFVIDF